MDTPCIREPISWNLGLYLLGVGYLVLGGRDYMLEQASRVSNRGLALPVLRAGKACSRGSAAPLWGYIGGLRYRHRTKDMEAEKERSVDYCAH